MRVVDMGNSMSPFFLRNGEVPYAVGIVQRGRVHARVVGESRLPQQIEGPEIRLGDGEIRGAKPPDRLPGHVLQQTLCFTEERPDLSGGECVEAAVLETVAGQPVSKARYTSDPCRR